MRTLGLDIGDETQVRMSADATPYLMTVVGEALVNDGFIIESGEVAVVDARSFGSTSTRHADMILLSRESVRSRAGAWRVTSACSVRRHPQVCAT